MLKLIFKEWKFLILVIVLLYEITLFNEYLEDIILELKGIKLELSSIERAIDLK